MVDREIWKEARIYGVLDDRVEARRWTSISRDCYNRRCRCEGCPYEAFFRKSREEHPTQLGIGYRCRCKAVVVKLIRTIGLPDLNANYNDSDITEE